MVGPPLDDQKYPSSAGVEIESILSLSMRTIALAAGEVLGSQRIARRVVEGRIANELLRGQ